MLHYLLLSISGILPSLPPDDPAHPWLERWSLRPGCELGDRRPLAGEDVLKCLANLDTAALGPVDVRMRRALIERLDLRAGRGGFGARPRWTSGPPDDPERDVLAIDLGVETGFLASGEDFVYGLDRASPESLRSPRTLLGTVALVPRFEVLLGDHLALWSRPRQIVDISDVARWTKRIDAREGLFHTALGAQPGEPARVRTLDWVQGGVEIATDWFRGRAGVLSWRWGFSPIEPLAFSGRAIEMPLVAVEHQVGPVHAEQLVANLIGDSFAENRRLYAHRVRWASAGQVVELAIQEVVITVDRPLEPLYMLPVLPYVMVEHLLGDPDNRQAGFEARVMPHPQARLSAELFLDDLQNWFGFFDAGWGNKWALSLGLELDQVTGAGAFDRVQLTRIEPWVYTSSASVRPGDPRNLPVHFGTSLGHDAGPDALDIVWIRRQDLSRIWSVTTEFNARWKGTGFGSSIHDNNSPADVTGEVREPLKEWLRDPVERTLQGRISKEVRMGNSWILEGGAGWIHRRDARGEGRGWGELLGRARFRL